MDTRKLIIYEEKEDPSATDFISEFISSPLKRYIFGTNSYAINLGEIFSPTAYIDDYTGETKINGVPIIRTSQIPEEALVVSAVVLGRPLFWPNCPRHFYFGKYCHK